MAFDVATWDLYMGSWNEALEAWMRPEGADLPACRAAHRRAMKHRDHLAASNLPLVKKLVGKLVRKSTSAAEIDDLIQAGAIGMLRALDPIKGYQPGRGAFSTYAAHWIRHEVQVSVGHQQPIHRPRGSGMPYPIWIKQEEIERKTGRPATAEELGVTQDQINAWQAGVIGLFAIDMPANMARGNQKVGSTHGTSQQDGICSLHDVIPDTAPNAEQMIGAEEVQGLMRAAMKELPARSVRILEALIVEGKSYKEVAKAESLSEPSILRIRNSALEELRAAVEDEDGEA